MTEKKEHATYAYEIYVEDKKIWEGLYFEKKFLELRKKNPGKEVSLAWVSKEDELLIL